jgi:ATP-dependent RNA helicase DDX1
VARRGQYYYEAVVSDEGLCRVGWSTIKSTRELGKDKQSFGFGGTGKKSFNSQFDDYGESFGLNDVIGCFLDLNKREMRFSKNGMDLGKAFEIPQHLLDIGFFAAVTLKNAEMKFNFGDSSFHYSPKGGFVGLSKADSQYVVPGATGWFTALIY